MTGRARAHTSGATIQHHRRVVRGALQAARFLVHHAAAAGRAQRRRHQQVVDAQAEVAAEGHHAVVPPRERALGLLEEAEGVDQAEVLQRAEGGAFGRRDVDLVFPVGVGVAVFGGDVEVAGQHQVLVRLEFFAQPVGERGEPAQLVLELVRAHRLAVWEVAAHDAHTIDGGGDDALLLVLEAGDVAHHAGLVDRLRAQDGDAVVGLLADEDGVVAGGLELGDREGLVLELELLQAERVGLVGGEPVEDLRQANLERVDVPGGDLHASLVYSIGGVSGSPDPKVMPKGNGERWRPEHPRSHPPQAANTSIGTLKRSDKALT